MDGHEKPELVDFLGRISHELRTPLNSLLILSSRLAENDEKNLTPRQIEYAIALRQSGTDLLDLIDEIIDFARTEAKAMPVRRTWLEVKELVSNLERTFREVANTKHIAFEIRTDPNAPASIETDPKLLRQVLRNLLSNAIKFTSEGGVTLSIQGGEDRIVFEVRDTGVGIALDEQEQIFDPYRQGHRRIVNEGVGLGLAISKRLTELLEGEIGVESSSGSGSVFRLSVPFRSTRRHVRRLRAEPKQQPLLLIHGSTILGNLFERAAKSSGIELVHSPTGERGLRLARELGPRAIVMDTMLPDLEGWILLDILKRDPRTRHIPVIALCSTRDARRARNLGAFDHAPVPRSEQEIEETVRAALRFSVNGPRTLLMVDGKSLEWPGIEIEHAASGKEALAAIAAHRPDCIVMPPALPDMSAVELMDRLHRTSLTRPIPTIVCADDGPTIQWGSLATVADVVIEPSSVSSATLIDSIARFLHLPLESLSDAHRTMVEGLRSRDPRLSGRKMMIVDDDVYSIFALTSALERHAIEVSFCESGHEAVGALRTSPVDAVLMDIVMPDMDGFETIRRIRAEPAHERLPIIAVTARAMPGDRQACLSAGADDYLPKPVDIDRLIAHLRSRLAAIHG